ncbi:Uncharacterised protein [uncultured archaeon]|nr:Uncharacterised protein [uncultured archaeon]
MFKVDPKTAKEIAESEDLSYWTRRCKAYLKHQDIHRLEYLHLPFPGSIRILQILLGDGRGS